VGAPSLAAATGAVFIYNITTDGNWTEIQYLPGKNNSQFGYSLALYNSTLVVGAVGFRYNTFDSQAYRKLSSHRLYYKYTMNNPYLNLSYILLLLINSFG
jgi:hypothetical protein